jgi:phage baseplate assembly protein W
MQVTYVPTIHGSTLSFPVRPDERGTLATVSDRAKIVEESVRAILETRKGERPMMPEYGLSDYVFATAGAGFVARAAFELEQQILLYEPLVEDVSVTVGRVEGERAPFVASVTDDPATAAFRVTLKIRGANVPHNLVFPTWELRKLTGAF